MSDFYSLFNKPEPNRPHPAEATVHPLDPARATRYAATALNAECHTVTTAPEGQRNHTLNKAAFSLGQLVAAGHLDHADTWNALATAGRTAGLTDTEIRATLASGLGAGQDHPRIVPEQPDIPAVTVLQAPDLDQAEVDAFWDTRPLLRHLHDYARARRVSPWAVLGVALARICTATPYTVTLPPIIGGRGSLNLFVGLVGTSGSGKGAAEAVAAEAITVGYIETLTTGSGEGIAHGYKRRVKGTVEWLDDHHAVLFSVPEIDTLAALGDRKGATLMPELRRGWSGERLGFAYADPLKRLPIEAHQYRMCLVAGIQPARAAVLLDDADGGTPQRFLWLPATDPHAPDQPPDAPEPIAWRPPTRPNTGQSIWANAAGTYDMTVCDLARSTIDQARLDRLRGRGHALDGHALLAQLKTAAILALADDRYNITDEDWQLADVIARKSAATRASVAEALRAKVTESNHARAEAEAGRAVLVAQRVEDAAIKRVCGVVVRKLRRVDDWAPRGLLARAVGRDGSHLEEALTRLLDAGQIEVEEFERTTKYRLSGGAA